MRRTMWTPRTLKRHALRGLAVVTLALSALVIAGPLAAPTASADHGNGMSDGDTIMQQVETLVSDLTAQVDEFVTSLTAEVDDFVSGLTEDIATLTDELIAEVEEWIADILEQLGDDNGDGNGGDTGGGNGDDSGGDV